MSAFFLMKYQEKITTPLHLEIKVRLASQVSYKLSTDMPDHVSSGH